MPLRTRQHTVLTLYEPVTLTWVLISVLSLLFSWELGAVFLTKHEVTCLQKNLEMHESGRQGPAQSCG